MSQQSLVQVIAGALAVLLLVVVVMRRKGKKKEDYLVLLQARSKAIVDYLVSKGVAAGQLQEAQYTKENFDALKGSEQDFNQEKPMEIRLLN